METVSEEIFDLVNERDEVPERRVHKQYISLGVRSQQQEMKLGTQRFVAVGTQQGASMIVLYLHGQGGSRSQGVNDFTFGGNFNRVKNLVAKAGGLVPTPLLRADATDLKAINPEQAFVGDMAALGRLAERYGAQRILVSVAAAEPDGPFAVSGTVYDFPTSDKPTLQPQSGVAADKLIDAAVRQRTRLEEDWKAVATLSHDIADAVAVIVPLKDLAEWVNIRRRISAAVSVRRVQVQSLEEGRAIVVVNFVGTRAQLDKALQQRGLALVDSGGSLSIVTR